LLIAERGAEEAEILAVVEQGEHFPAKFGRTGFRGNLAFNGEWMGHGNRLRICRKPIEKFVYSQ
jgi:hypothetical protein